jgi:Xaa-Pro aminopeptidase
MCDFTRTFSVGPPSQLQQDAWAHVMAAHAIARRTIRPGVPAKEVYHAIKSHLDKFKPAEGSFWHHAGHGVGMSGWEFPWLTPGSDDVVQDREVLACEPGLYAEAMQGGIRLEHNYLVTPEGVTTLDHFPMDLT